MNVQQISGYRRAFIVIGFISIFVLILYALVHYIAAGRDDTFLMLWAGQQMGYGHWFINFNYQTQEIASSMIGVFVAALTKNLPENQALLLVKMIGLLSALLVFYIIWKKRKLIFDKNGSANEYALGTLIATASSPVFMYWVLGGLETPHHALLLLLFCIVLVQALFNKSSRVVDWPLIIASCFLILVRVEEFWPIVLGAFLVLLVRRNIKASASVLRALIFSLTLFAILLCIRYAFTNAIWPNPVYAKVGDYETALPAGLKYITDYFTSSTWSMLQGMSLIFGIWRIFSLFKLMLDHQEVSKHQVFVLVVSTVTIFQLIFVFLTGGNWMEYFRFISAAVPLLNILTFIMLDSFINAAQFSNIFLKQKNSLTLILNSRSRDNVNNLQPNSSVIFKLSHMLVNTQAIPISVAIVAAISLSQIGKFSTYNAGSCAKPFTSIAEFFAFANWSKIAIANNCAHSRDTNAIKPFIDNKIDSLLKENNGHLTIASYQAGYFPYLLRQKFSEQQIWFIDSAGLNELEIARLPGKRVSTGMYYQYQIDQIMMGNAGSLSDYFKLHQINLIYLLSASPVERTNFEKLGFRIILDVAGAIVFYKPNDVYRILD